MVEPGDRPVRGLTGDAATGRIQATVAPLSPAQIRDIRNKAGLSQKALAKALNVSPNSICNWETGRTAPRGENVEKLLAVGK